MACGTLTGYTNPCRTGVGGIRKVWAAFWTSGSAYTIVSGQVTGVTGTPTFVGYEQETESSDFKDNYHTNRVNGTFFSEQDLSLMFLQGSAAKRNEVLYMAQNRLLMVALDEDGIYWIIGRQRGAMLEPSDFSTGKASGDMNGWTLKFKAKEPLPAETLQASVVTTMGLT